MKSLCLFLVLGINVCRGAITVSTANYDNSRNGANVSETALTPSSVGGLAKLGSYTLDGPVLSQPLYVPSISISGTVHNVLIVGTMNNTLYALDADRAGSTPLWQTNFGATWNIGSGAFFNVFYTTCCVGILSTPVIDVSGGFIYLVTVNNTPAYTLRKVAMTTGAQASSVVVSGSVVGTGAGTVGGVTDDTTGSNLNFHASFQLQRGALTLANGNVYLNFGAAGDELAVWHGWVFGYSTTSLSQVGIFCTTPNANGAGVWEAGGAAVDGSGNLYFASGNGDWDGATAFSQTVFKTNSTLVLQDWFTPSNHASTSTADADLSSGRVMLIPGTTLLTLGSKDGRVWAIDTTNMGHLQGTGAAPQVFNSATFTATGGSGIYGGLFAASAGTFSVSAFPFYTFSFSGTAYNTIPVLSVSSFRQSTLTSSSNAGTNVITWAVTPDSGSPIQTQRAATLRAFNAVTLVEYWNSGTGNIGTMAKFVSPLIAAGHVYIASWDGTITEFGLPGNLTGAASISGNASIQ